MYSLSLRALFENTKMNAAEVEVFVFACVREKSLGNGQWGKNKACDIVTVFGVNCYAFSLNR